MSSAASPVIHKADRIALWVIAAVAFALSLVWAIVAGVRAVGPYVFDEPVAVDLLLTDGSTALASLDGVVDSRAESEVVSVAVDAFSAGPMAQIVATSTLAALIIAFVSAVVGFTIVRITQGRPFQRSLYTLGISAGSVLALGGLLTEGLGGGGRMVLANELNTRLGDDRFVVGFTLNPAPIAIGFAIIALATVFLLGERLQRDTEGLV